MLAVGRVAVECWLQNAIWLHLPPAAEPSTRQCEIEVHLLHRRFFIRDGMAFPDLVHALRPNPVNNIQEVGAQEYRYSSAYH